MISLEKNSFGSISLSKEILEGIVEQAILQQKGSLLLSTSKGRISSKVESGNSPSVSVRCRQDVKGSLIIKIYLAFSFGRSLKKSTESLKKDIFSALKELIGNQRVYLQLRVRGIVHNGYMKRLTELDIDFDNGNELDGNKKDR